MSGLLVGVFVTFAAMVVLLVLYARLTSAGVIGVEEYNLFSNFEKAQGLRSGTEVQINGVRVGHVSDINLESDGTVRIQFTIKKEFQPWITDKATIYPIRDQNVISERVINIDVQKGEGKVLEDGGYITAGKAQDIETVLETLNEVLNRVTVLIDEADTLVALTMDTGTTIGALLGSRTIYEKLNTQLDRLDYFSFEGIKLLDKMSGTLPNILERTDTLTQNLFTLTDQLQGTPDKINGVFTNLDGMFKNADGVFGRLNGTIDSLNSMVGDVGGLMNRGEGMLESADDLLEGVSNMWIIRRTLPTHDSVPLLGEDAW